MIGKIFHAFSNDWKKFSAQGERKGIARGKRKERKGVDAKNAKAEGGRGVGGMREEECGRRNATRISRMPWRGLEGWVGGGCYIDKRENRFADIEKLSGHGRVAYGDDWKQIFFLWDLFPYFRPPISRPFFFPKLRPFFRG